MSVDYLVTFRLASWDTPLWISPNRSDARFNRRGEWTAQYMSLHPLTPWAEYIRREGYRTEEEIDELRLRTWALRIPDNDIYDLNYETAKDWGLLPDALVGDDYGPCQDVAQRMLADPRGPRVLRVPSAALPGTDNIVILGPRAAAPYSWPPVDPDIDVPVAVTAEDAIALATLLPMVRYVGDPHRGLQAWKAGEEFTFVHPAAPHLPSRH